MTFHNPLIIVDYKTAASLINKPIMEDLACRNIVGMKPASFRRLKGDEKPSPVPLSPEECTTLFVVAGYTYTRDGDLNVGGLVEVLITWLECGKDKVVGILRDLETAGFLRQVQNEDRSSVFHWQLRDKALRDKLAALADMLEKIDEVVKLQRKSPENSGAGKDLVPENIYFDIAANRAAHRAAQK